MTSIVALAACMTNSWASGLGTAGIGAVWAWGPADHKKPAIARAAQVHRSMIVSLIRHAPMFDFERGTCAFVPDFSKMRNERNNWSKRAFFRPDSGREGERESGDGQSPKSSRHSFSDRWRRASLIAGACQLPSRSRGARVEVVSPN